MWAWALGGLAALIALAAIAEAYVKRGRAPRRLADTQPDMPKAKSNLGFGFEPEWRPKLPEDSDKRTSK